MLKVIVMSGISGSGKSTYLKALRKNEYNDNRSLLTIVSADAYFYRNGVYVFEKGKLQQAHGRCFADYIKALQSHTNQWDRYIIGVDNTNTTAIEIAPYMAGASAYGFDAEIITIQCKDRDDIEVCARRNVHCVSSETVRDQNQRLWSRSLPSYWKSKYILPTFQSAD